jgi:hypothetical protein
MEIQSFLIKAKLGHPIHLRSTGNTMMEPGINGAIFPQTVREKRGGAVNYKST